MRLLIDGKEVEFLENVKIIYDDGEYFANGDETPVEPHLTITNEGVIVDNFADGEVYTSSWYFVQDLVDNCH
jgi:hypothetical protein